MIFFVTGLSSRNIYINDILEKNSKEKLHFNENTVQEFLMEVDNISIFSEPTLLILKNANKVKDIEKILKNIKDKELDDKDIIIDYESTKENKKLKELASNFEYYEIFNEKENRKNLLNYIMAKLKCKSIEASNILEIVGDNFYALKNEIDKICSYLNGDSFDFSDVREIISKNTNFFIFDLTDKILKKEYIEFPIKEHLAILASLCNDFEIMYKIHVSNLKKSKYDTFKENISNFEIFKAYSPYSVYKKLDYMNNFKKERILELLELAFKTERDIKNGILPIEDGVENFILQVTK